MYATSFETVINAAPGVLCAKLKTSSMLIYNTKNVVVPIKDIFKIDFNNSTIALSETIRFNPFIGSIFLNQILTFQL